jgi:hypothetical protein
VGFERDAEEIAQLAVEVGHAALRMGQGADRDLAQAAEALGQHPERHALAGARVAGDEREAPLADVALLEAPAEVVELRGREQGLARQLGREGIPLQAVQGQPRLGHRDGSSSSGRRSGR